MKFYNQLQVAITALLLTATGQAYSQSSSCGEYDESCSCTPSCCGAGFISASFLYWRADQGGLDCGCLPDEINNYILSDGNVISKTKGNHHDSHYKWDPGFRIGAGYEFGCKKWDIAVFWTHFQSNKHNGHHHDQFHWKLDYDVIDVLVGRSFCLDSFTIRPFIGVRAAEIDQKVKSKSRIAYNTFFNRNSSSYQSSSDYSSGLPDAASLETSTQDFLDTKVHNKENFRGIGPLIGIEADLCLGCGFNLYACLSVSSLYGDFNIKSRGSSSFLNGSNFCDEKSHFNHCQLATDAIIGIGWETCLCSSWEVAFLLAWEQHRYFNHNRMGDYGDLCLDGVSFSAGFAF